MSPNSNTIASDGQQTYTPTNENYEYNVNNMSGYVHGGDFDVGYEDFMNRQYWMQNENYYGDINESNNFDSGNYNGNDMLQINQGNNGRGMNMFGESVSNGEDYFDSVEYDDDFSDSESEENSSDFDENDYEEDENFEHDNDGDYNLPEHVPEDLIIHRKNDQTITTTIEITITGERSRQEINVSSANSIQNNNVKTICSIVIDNNTEYGNSKNDGKEQENYVNSVSLINTKNNNGNSKQDNGKEIFSKINIDIEIDRNGSCNNESDKSNFSNQAGIDDDNERENNNDNFEGENNQDNGEEVYVSNSDRGESSYYSSDEESDEYDNQNNQTIYQGYIQNPQCPLNNVANPVNTNYPASNQVYVHNPQCPLNNVANPVNTNYPASYQGYVHNPPYPNQLNYTNSGIYYTIPGNFTNPPYPNQLNYTNSGIHYTIPGNFRNPTYN